MKCHADNRNGHNPERSHRVIRSLILLACLGLGFRVLSSIHAVAGEAAPNYWDWNRCARSSTQLETFMAKPPAIARPGVLWFWFKGDVSKEVVSEQIESMREAGVSHAELRCIDDNHSAAPQPRQRPEMKYLSDAWLDVFDHACAEADRCSITLGVVPGMAWMHGGPWITEEHAGKRLNWEGVLAHTDVCKAR